MCACEHRTTNSSVLDNAATTKMTEVFVIGCPLPKKDFPYDNTVIKSANRDLGNPEMIRENPPT